MSPDFERWLKLLNSYQTRRSAGEVGDAWGELDLLESRLIGLAIGGLDYHAAAKCLLELERAALLHEQRDYDEAHRRATACVRPALVSGPAAELIDANRELALGNIYLVRDADFSAAAVHFANAINASGPATVFIRGNAAINLGICQSLSGQNEAAVRSYQLAASSYAAAGREDKIGVALQSLGNAYRTMGEADRGIHYLQEAVKLHLKFKNNMSLWYTADDLARCYLMQSELHPGKYQQWLDLASSYSDMACFASTEVWNTVKSDPRRLADLSDQLVNLTVTRCDIADQKSDAPGLVGTLALMKGRIRLSTSDIPASIISSQSEDHRHALEAGVPLAYFNVVGDALASLKNGKSIALLDQFAIGGNRLMMAYIIMTPDAKVVGAFHNGLPEASEYDPAVDLRGRGRASEISRECDSLITEIASHSRRCAMMVPDDPSSIGAAARDQLREWAEEFQPSLQRLGALFFPEEVLQEFRSYDVEHVVLSVDPLLLRVPYTALIAKDGPVIDQPWSLSFITASTELLRILDRRGSPALLEEPVCWIAPDEDVNERLGGNAELDHLKRQFRVEELRGDRATVATMVRSLSNGRWCHFRGHGSWTGAVSSSGPVLAHGEVLSTSVYNEIRGWPGFLFTAACLTGFGEAIGTEAFGSLVDYDDAGLVGAVLTSWPIHGVAATMFTSYFYAELRKSAHVGRAIKVASRATRQALPHPYLWAPFAAIGGWEVSRTTTREQAPQQPAV